VLQILSTKPSQASILPAISAKTTVVPIIKRDQTSVEAPKTPTRNPDIAATVQKWAAPPTKMPTPQTFTPQKTAQKPSLNVFVPAKEISAPKATTPIAPSVVPPAKPVPPVKSSTFSFFPNANKPIPTQPKPPAPQPQQNNTIPKRTLPTEVKESFSRSAEAFAGIGQPKKEVVESVKESVNSAVDPWDEAILYGKASSDQEQFPLIMKPPPLEIKLKSTPVNSTAKTPLSHAAIPQKTTDIPTGDVLPMRIFDDDATIELNLHSNDQARILRFNRQEKEATNAANSTPNIPKKPVIYS